MPAVERVDGLVIERLPLAYPWLAPYADLVQVEDASWDGLFVAAARAALRLGSAGHREMLERYTWEHTYQQLIEVYSSSH